MGRAKRVFSLLREMIKEYLADDGPFLAAGIAFYAFFSLFPLALISVAILTHIFESDLAIDYTLKMSADFLPNNMVKFLDTNLRALTQDRKTIGVAGLIMLLWSGRQLFRAMELSLHKAWDIPLKRSLVGGNMLAMLLVLLCGAVVFTVGVASAALNWLRLALSRFNLPHLYGWSIEDANFYAWLQSWVVVPLATALIFLLLYVILPSKQVPVYHAIPGAFFSSVAWKLSSLFYLEFIVQFGRANPLYGSVWGIIGLLVWLYLEACVFLLGAELVYVTYHTKRKKH